MAPLDSQAVSSEPERPRHAKGEEGRGKHKHRHHHGEGDGVRMRGGETRIPQHSGGGEADRPASGGNDKPKPNR